MKTMLAAYLPGNSTVDLREVAVPTPGINQVLIKMKSSGIYGSDVHYIYHQHRATAAAPDKPLYQGFINGHEPCGQIVAMGQGCRHFKEGDRVLACAGCWLSFCPNCRRGFPISCTGKGKAAYGWQRDGGHAGSIMTKKKILILLPDALSYEDGAFISCGVGTAYEGILRGEVSGSDNVLVVGLGPVGMMAMMLAKGRGAKRIIGVDMLPERLAMAKQLGVIDHYQQPPKVCRRLSPNSPTVARMLRSIVLVMPQVACWRCDPPLTGDGWFTSEKRKSESRSAPI